MSFLRSYDGWIAADQITLIEPQVRTAGGTTYHTVHYRYLFEMHETRAHPDYVRKILKEQQS